MTSADRPVDFIRAELDEAPLERVTLLDLATGNDALVQTTCGDNDSEIELRRAELRTHRAPRVEHTVVALYELREIQVE